jgi:hypothetical protein
MLNKIKQAVKTVTDVAIIAPRMLVNTEFKEGVNKALESVHLAVKERKYAMDDLKKAFKQEKNSINALYRSKITATKKEFKAMSSRVFETEKKAYHKELRKKAVKKSIKKTSKTICKTLRRAFN